MNYRIIHNLPQRMRISLTLPKRHTPENSQIERLFLAIDGVQKVSFNCRTRNLLVSYNGDRTVRVVLLKIIKETSLIFVKKENFKQDKLEQKKKAAVLSGALLIARPIIPFILAPLFALYGAMPVLRRGFRATLNRRLNVDTLDSAAIGISLLRGDYLTASLITFFLKVGDYLEERIRQKSRKSLSKMFQSQDGWAWIKRNGWEMKVNIKDIAAGDLVVVRTGSSIPVDGIVAEGVALVNQSSMTGEPVSVPKMAGLMVYAGTVLEEGLLTIKSIRVGDETRVSKIIKVIEESEGLKADVQNYAEMLANKIVPYSFLLSGLIYLFASNPLKAASVLLVDYSCSIKLSTPLTIMSAMIAASKRGVLIKGGRFIEKLAQANIFVFDKTGTLTEAKPKVFDLLPFNGFNREYLLKNVACVEEHFPHPVATAVVKRAEDEGLVHEENHAEVEYVLAHGIASRIEGKRILVGSKHFICEDNKINVEREEPVIKDFMDRGYSILYVAVEDKLAGVVAIEDHVREDSQKFLKMLKNLGVERTIMLTGDNDATARNVAKRLGIEEYYAQVLPERKTGIIKDLKGRGYVVVMVGDGINDSPAISYADVGISLKHGADIAREACDILLLDVAFEGIIEAREIAQDAMSRIKKNFGYIIGINSALIGLGILGVIAPVTSAFIHNATTILVAANSLKPYRISPCRGREDNGLK
ncbi:MAG: heavy metal translocating P-type ATPase [Candidatus Brocadia sp. AMX2]|uniref:heavy metal translocating P-type ATPase n=1 Tax=Candidatus Brocadia TaxID=380240 RepID=UPI000698E7CD|nr:MULTISPECIES: heavy metal translocating P-type ATPase [Brocadia]MBC6932414.1 heavy metal translocating P-type ATPase [Candidatus Brocadia sp.]MBL1170713.1 heavy metal translocating P-type ATPase [Candidatus Brocadia sp. AMX1]KAA0244826.1 MAG: heavy metal translocating P-type ATPase [Candidatus Brocadia sp. AMX2]MCE7866803.1 heavy metal translocating P-type ATPase [Candidatus Brocadia sp. AMX2]MCQ3917509.1 heavy metal translocating P-type ATPase [Candidatus Brocadia sp.]